MSFFSSIGSAIGSAFSAITGLASGAGGGIGGALGSIGSSIGSIVGDVKSTLDAVTSSGLGQAFSSVSSVINSLNGIVDSVKGDISAFISPIQTLVGSVTGLARNISDGLVTPVENLIKTTQTSANEIITAFTTDLSHGLSGLAQLPVDIAKALTSTNAAFGRATQQLGEINRTTASDVLGPAIDGISAKGLDPIHQALLSGHKAFGAVPDDFASISLSQPPDYAAMKAQFEATTKQIEHPTSWQGWLGYFFYTALLTAEWFNAEKGPLVAEQRMAAAAGTPVAPLAPELAIRANFRNLLNQEDTDTEVRKAGIDISRQAVLKGLNEFLLGPGEAISLWARGLISETERDVLLGQNAVRPDSVNDLVALAFAPANFESLIRASGRIAAANQGLLASSIKQSAPEAVQALASKDQVAADQADISWANHWSIPGMGWWIQAYFRSIRTRTEVDLAAQALNIPEEVINDLIDVERPLIQLWMVPDIIATGAMTQVEAMAYMARMGFNEADASIMVNYGLSKAGSAVSAQYADLAKVNISNSTALYEAGAITRQDLINIYLAHKYTQAAAELTVEAVDLKAAAAARKQVVADLEARVSLGDITATEAISQGYKEGLTDVEIAAMVKSFNTNRVAKQKLPTEAQLLKMVKEGLIQATDYVAGLELLGYNQTWAALIAESELGLPKGTLPGG